MLSSANEANHRKFKTGRMNYVVKSVYIRDKAIREI